MCIADWVYFLICVLAAQAVRDAFRPCFWLDLPFLASVPCWASPCMATPQEFPKGSPDRQCDVCVSPRPFGNATMKVCV